METARARAGKLARVYDPYRGWWPFSAFQKKDAATQYADCKIQHFEKMKAMYPDMYKKWEVGANKPPQKRTKNEQRAVNNWQEILEAPQCDAPFDRHFEKMKKGYPDMYKK